jgi:phosphocarrier protein
MSAKAIAGGQAVMTKDFHVLNKLGIHARPAASFVKTANRFHCEIFVEKDGEKVNGKSIMGLMMLGAEKGTQLKLRCFGSEDAEECLRSLTALVQGKFGEE